MNVVLITALIFLVSNAIAFLYTVMVQTVPFFKKQRIQATSYFTRSLFRRLPLTLFNMVAGASLSCFAVYYFRDYFELAFPSWLILLGQIGIVIICDDLYYYFYHRLMHHPLLYRHIHALHHRAKAPFPFDFYYFHPVELFAASVGGVIGFVIIYFLFGSLNIYAFWGYYCWRSLHEMDLHSGLPSFLLRWLPFYGSTKHHDDHHAYVKGNYASTFNILDKIFNTRLK